MKKLLFVAFMAMFCLGSAAQNEYESEVDEFVEVDSTEVEEQSGSKTKHTVPKQDDSAVTAQLAEVSALINQLKELTLNGGDSVVDVREFTDIYKPIRGKSKFARRHYIYQTLDISPSINHDHDSDQPEYTSKGQEVDDDQLSSPIGYGLNFGYSLYFVPGREENEQLRLNRMGVAYNLGLVFSVGKQDKYGVTCNFLLKTGIETGNGHPMGIGFDILGGYGKSTGDCYLTVYDENDEDDLAQPYTEWCWQYGAQLWLRTNLLKTAINNAEMLIFARLVRSVNPNNGESVRIDDKTSFDNYWKEEQWSFGATFRYYF